ncbi:MAG: monovalent cation/H(+) antiporter subunit G [Burkholderiaceae bacterium]|jgi:multicomponent Na+:H+ antiporter subunit G|nr:monovalent cation/H(+) antiporter subunit G [Burkholderiaceae bacterium]
MTTLATVLLASGALVLVIAAWGVIVLPDALARQHAATKAGTLALALTCLGAMAAAGDPQWTWRLLLILGFVLVTLPVASHMLARAAVREAGLDEAVDGAAPVGTMATERSHGNAD